MAINGWQGDKFALEIWFTNTTLFQTWCRHYYERDVEFWKMFRSETPHGREGIRCLYKEKEERDQATTFFLDLQPDFHEYEHWDDNTRAIQRK